MPHCKHARMSSNFFATRLQHMTLMRPLAARTTLIRRQHRPHSNMVASPALSSRTSRRLHRLLRQRLQGGAPEDRRLPRSCVKATGPAQDVATPTSPSGDACARCSTHPLMLKHDGCGREKARSSLRTLTFSLLTERGIPMQSS